MHLLSTLRTGNTMIAAPLSQPSGSKTPAELRGEQPQFYEIVNKGFGKDVVRVLHVKREGSLHSVQELEVGTHLKLYSNKDYLHGDNSDVFDTDAQKNTVYVLAKKYGIESPEKFAQILAKHFISKYAQVEETHVHVETYPWQRIRQENSAEAGTSQPHNHAFVLTPTSQHYCDVIIKRHDPQLTVISGFKGLRILKTTQSRFVDFFRDEYRMLKDQYDRNLSVVIDCAWEYSDTESVDFERTWQKVKDIVLQNFVGDPSVGILSTSAQNSMYRTEKQVLDELSHVSVVSMTVLNKQYEPFDVAPFQQLVPGENKDVFMRLEKPHSTVHVKLSRKDISRES